ncbi:MAG: hypothetical protein M3O99_07170 [Chloroflexota bacterium]|nr:hypothetical protein [Chloroflexota bacterium]
MNHRAVWLTAAVLAVVVLVAQVAGAATREMPASLPTSASVSAELTATTPTVALPEQASSVATEKSATGVASANEAITTSTTAKVNKAPAAAAPVDASSGARPGWGCGDTNHTHSGPPGRPDATPPPGCTRP